MSSNLIGFGGYQSFGATPESTGMTTKDFCNLYVVRADGRCQDSSGIHQLQWYNKKTGRCEEPPPVPCDVNAPNIAAPTGPTTPTAPNGATSASAGLSTEAWVAIAVIAGVGVWYVATRNP